MISAKSEPSRGLVVGLTAQARRIAEAYAENRRRALLRDPARWRSAALLWPNFARDL